MLPSKKPFGTTHKAMIHGKTFFSRSHKPTAKPNSGLFPQVFIKICTQWISNWKNVIFKIPKNPEEMSWRVVIFEMSNNNFENYFSKMITSHIS